MAIEIGAASQLIASPSIFSNTAINVAVNGSVSEKSIQPQITVQNSSIATNGIKPEPILTVDEQGDISSPYVEITQQLTENSAIRQQKSSQPAVQDNTLSQLQELTGQQQDIQARKESLEEQEQKIEQEINQLQQKELEINRKRFQLQRQSNLGQFINVQI